ncbi:HAD family hydrolase [Desulfogranum japonicum]|uniref:HAD family hydrolase n=1 Tax=Desulfogranum japonicum TaxID=231447 RepID=UPI000405D770|nr:HAD family phosphatase [Desulfogranum japonicum]
MNRNDKLQGILWDNDGVLVETEYLFYLANKELLLRYSLELSEEDYFEWYLKRNVGAWHLLSDIGIDEEQISELRAQRNALYSEKIEQAQQLALYGVENLLQTLHGKVPMGVVTSSYKEHFEAIHQRLNMRQYFDFVLANGDYAQSKPSPEPYILGLNKLGKRATNCVVVEDSPRGLQAAKAAGIRCIILRGRVTAGYDFRGAYTIVDNTEELADVLMNLV